MKLDPAKAAAILRRYAPHFWLVLVTLVLCMTLKEFYPLSHFPMYSAFDHRAYYVYVTDQDDHPVHFRAQFNESAQGLLKIFRGYVKERGSAAIDPRDPIMLDYMRAAGEDTLRRVIETRRTRTTPESYQSIKLYFVHMRREHGRFEESTHLVAEIAPVPAPPAR